jgi:hypothetical protein
MAFGLKALVLLVVAGVVYSAIQKVGLTLPH